MESMLPDNSGKDVVQVADLCIVSVAEIAGSFDESKTAITTSRDQEDSSKNTTQAFIVSYTHDLISFLVTVDFHIY